ncbi:hypothetical protein FRC02_009375 [Tulasnella sp. 418]|nr:hypothetical protein FRC02_009375 [Tulasnella sp. 418]
MSEGQLSAASLFARALSSASRSTQLSSIDEETQDIIKSSVADLRLLSSRLESLSLFSENETLEDLSTKDLVYMFVPYVLAEVLGRLKTEGGEERIERVQESIVLFRRFVKRLDDYEVIPAEERVLFGPQSASIANDPAKRRESKIQKYKKEVEIRNKITALRSRKGLPEIAHSNDFELILSLLPASSGVKNESDDIDDADDDVVRELTLLVLRFLWTQTHTHLDSLQQELTLLKNRPAEDNRERPSGSEDTTWKLDFTQGRGPDGKGPLLDKDGKPLRPFTILPSTASSERARLQAQVFQPDHRLPTMTIDEYLEIERQRGNIISGGGPQSENQPTSSEQLAIDAEQDGTLAGDLKNEEKRLKDEAWANFTDANPRGSGNTMNRG